LFTVTPTCENRCRGFYRQGVGSLLESVIMCAVEVAEAGGPEVLTYVEKPQPSPRQGEVLIKAEAALGRTVATAEAIGVYAEYCIAPADLVATTRTGSVPGSPPSR
jgi:hypothetical protein